MNVHRLLTNADFVRIATGGAKRVQGVRHHRRSAPPAADRRLHDVRRHVQADEPPRHGVVGVAAAADVVRVVGAVPARRDDQRALRESGLAVGALDGRAAVPQWDGRVYADQQYEQRVHVEVVGGRLRCGFGDYERVNCCSQ